ncbi:MAG TPA: MOSC domain-containing protein [Thermomicrobiales bacterium]|nr:MOSC domain-containing protein [Thermomicrobiales bacterium]HRA47875.1 MOSC domain-containing protein [Thermomicrobiales bacterium]
MIELVSVNVGMPVDLGVHQGTRVLSGIRKRPVTESMVQVSTLNIAGDGQGDLVAHGGVDKAIFAYPRSHLTAWAVEFGQAEPFRYGNIGDNLTIGNLDETDVCIGDIWRWGEVRLQISQPRYPCYKLGMAVGDPIMVKRFMATGRSGWYIRVLTPGLAPTSGAITIESRDPSGMTVREVALSAYGEADNVRRQEIAGHPLLAPAWKKILQRRMAEPANV